MTLAIIAIISLLAGIIIGAVLVRYGLGLGMRVLGHGEILMGSSPLSQEHTGESPDIEKELESE